MPRRPADAGSQRRYQRRAWSRIAPSAATSGSAGSTWISDLTRERHVVMTVLLARAPGVVHPLARSHPRSARSTRRTEIMPGAAYPALIPRRIGPSLGTLDEPASDRQ